TAYPASASDSDSARPIRRAPPVTSAARGTGRVGNAPVSTASSVPGGSRSAAGTAFLSTRPHLGAHRLARRYAGAAHRRAAAQPARRALGEPELDLFQPA